MWAISLYLNLGSAIRKIFIIRQKTGDTELSEEGVRELEKLEREQYINIIQVTGRAKNSHLIKDLTQAGCDLINAIHWLPPGHLWSGRLSQGRVGINGFISSIISLYKFIRTLK